MVKDIGKTVDRGRVDAAGSQESQSLSLTTTQHHPIFDKSDSGCKNNPQGNQCKKQHSTNTLDDFHVFDYVHREHSYVAIEPMSTLQEVKQNDQSQSPDLTLPVKQFNDGIVAQDINSFLQQYQEFEKLASGSLHQLQYT